MNLFEHTLLKLQSNRIVRSRPDFKMATNIFVRRDDIPAYNSLWAGKSRPAVNGFTWMWFEAEKMPQEKYLYRISTIIRTKSYQKTWRGERLISDDRYKDMGGFNDTHLRDHWNATALDNPQIVAQTLKSAEDVVMKSRANHFGDTFRMSIEQPLSAIYYGRFLAENNAGKPPTLTVVG